MSDSRESRVNRSQILEKEKEVQWHCDLRLFFKNIYSTCIITVPSCTWSVALRPLFIFLLDKRSQNNPFEVDCWSDLFSLPFEKRARIPCLVWSRVLCACRCVFRFGSLDIIGGDALLITHDDTSNRYRSGSNRHFCLHPNIRDE